MRQAKRRRVPGRRARSILKADGSADQKYLSSADDRWPSKPSGDDDPAPTLEPVLLRTTRAFIALAIDCLLRSTLRLACDTARLIRS